MCLNASIELYKKKKRLKPAALAYSNLKTPLSEWISEWVSEWVSEWMSEWVSQSVENSVK